MSSKSFARVTAALVVLSLILASQALAQNSKLTHEWDFEASEEDNIGDVVYHQGSDSLVVGASDSVYLLDSKGQIIDSFDLNGNGTVTDLHITNLDQDGLKEIIVGTGWMETKKLNESGMEINKTGVSFSEKVVYKITRNRGNVYSINLDKNQLTHLFEAEGWVRDISSETLYSKWDTNLIVAAGGSNHDYYKQRLPDTVYRRACYPSVEVVENQAGEENISKKWRKVGDDIQACRGPDHCDSFHGNPKFYEDCCGEDPCCDRNDSTCNGTSGYPSEKDCFYIAEDQDYMLWDEDSGGYVSLGYEGPGCYQVEQWDCVDLTCHPLAMQFKTDTFSNGKVSIYSPEGEKEEEGIAVSNMTFSECNFNITWDTVHDFEISDFLQSSTGKEMIFNVDNYLFMYTSDFESLVGLFPGCDYLKTEYAQEEMRKINEFRIYDVDGDEEDEILMVYADLGELQIIDKTYNWAEQGECREEINGTTGEKSLVFATSFADYSSPDWTYRMPLGMEIGTVKVTEMAPYNHSQMMVVAKDGLRALSYGKSEAELISNQSGIDDAYFYDVDDNNIENVLLVKKGTLRNYELSPEFLKRNSAESHLNTARELSNTNLEQAKNHIEKAIELFSELGNSQRLSEAKALDREITEKINAKIKSDADSEYAAALSNYEYNNEKARTHVEKAIELYRKINHTKGLQRAKELKQKIDKALDTTTTTTTTTATTTSSITTTTTPTKSLLEKEIVLIPVAIVVTLLLILGIHRLAKKYSERKKKEKSSEEVSEEAKEQKL